MPASPQSTELCRYRYDPLDRRVASTLHQQTDLQHFYCKSRLASEIQGAQHRSIFQHDDQLLAQQSSQNAKVDTTLLATDQQRSVLNTQSATQSQAFAYTPYGERSPKNGLPSLLGFKGERLDPLTENYDLGKGYRRYNTRLMRFDSPDSLSPFGEGGLNTYGFVAGDPVNLSDPTGHFPVRKLLVGAIVGVGVSSGIAAVFTEGEVRIALTVAAAAALFSAASISTMLSAKVDRPNISRHTPRHTPRPTPGTIEQTSPLDWRRGSLPRYESPLSNDSIELSNFLSRREPPPPYPFNDQALNAQSLNSSGAYPFQSPTNSLIGASVLPSTTATNQVARIRSSI